MKDSGLSVNDIMRMIKRYQVKNKKFKSLWSNMEYDSTYFLRFGSGKLYKEMWKIQPLREKKEKGESVKWVNEEPKEEDGYMYEPYLVGPVKMWNDGKKCWEYFLIYLTIQNLQNLLDLTNMEPFYGKVFIAWKTEKGILFKSGVKLNKNDAGVSVPSFDVEAEMRTLGINL